MTVLFLSCVCLGHWSLPLSFLFFLCLLWNVRVSDFLSHSVILCPNYPLLFLVIHTQLFIVFLHHLFSSTGNHTYHKTATYKSHSLFVTLPSNVTLLSSLCLNLFKIAYIHYLSMWPWGTLQNVQQQKYVRCGNSCALYCTLKIK